MFDYYEMLHARSGNGDSASTRLAVFGTENFDKLCIEISKAAFGPLLEYASERYQALPEAEKARYPLDSDDPFDRLNQQVAYLTEVAPEFLEKTGSPFIIDRIPSNKSEKPSRIMGFENSEGLYTRCESESPQQGFLSILKMAFKKDFREFSVRAKEELKKESANPEVYGDRVKAAQRKASSPNSSRSGPGLG